MSSANVPAHRAIAMDERAALAVTAVKAVETARPRARGVDGRRPRVGEPRGRRSRRCDRRAARVRLARRAHARARAPRRRAAPASRGSRVPAHWRPWVGTAAHRGRVRRWASLADHIGSAQRINILAPPVRPRRLECRGLCRCSPSASSCATATPRRRDRCAARSSRARRAASRARRARGRPDARCAAAFARDWSAASAPLYAARAARILHLAAAAFALGVIGSLYVRGLAFEYRATWESTFLDAVERALAGSRSSMRPVRCVSGIAVPDAAHIAAIRAPASENAAPWLHLMAATLAMVVIAPRLVLALGIAGWCERYRAAHLMATLRRRRTSRGCCAISGEGRSPCEWSRTASRYGGGRRRARGAARARIGRPARRWRSHRRWRMATRTASRPWRTADADRWSRCSMRRPRRSARRMAVFSRARRAATPARPRAGHRRRGGVQRALARRCMRAGGAARAVARCCASQARLAPVFVDLADPDLAREEAVDAALAGTRRATANAAETTLRHLLALASVTILTATIALSLISHTNAGKTTLARTLLGRDVGEVRDAPHVTTEAAAYPLIDDRRGRRAGAVGHAGIRRQRAARQPARAAGQSRSAGS